MYLLASRAPDGQDRRAIMRVCGRTSAAELGIEGMGWDGTGGWSVYLGLECFGRRGGSSVRGSGS
jgi:hypothetical protein